MFNGIYLCPPDRCLGGGGGMKEGIVAFGW